MNEEIIQKARNAVREAEAVIITAGAGMGVDSGLPDFRGKEGFWNAYPAAKKLNLEFQEMANPYWFSRDPELAWAFYGHRLNLYRRTNPHPGFKLLLEYAGSRKYGYFVFTSNVDGQFQKAGFDGDRIEECHGSIHHFQCAHNCNKEIFSAPEYDIRIDEESFRAIEPLPSCPSCGDIARPNILMFGDWGWNSSRTGEQSKRFTEFFNTLISKNVRPVIIEIGAGHSVPTVRMTSEEICDRSGGVLIRINPRDTDIPAGNISLCDGGQSGIETILDS